MTQTFRVRFASEMSGRVRAEHVRTADYPGPLADLPRLLPAGAYVLSIVDLSEDRDVHWTRWPGGIRPGMKDKVTGRVVT